MVCLFVCLPDTSTDREGSVTDEQLAGTDTKQGNGWELHITGRSSAMKLTVEGQLRDIPW